MLKNWLKIGSLSLMSAMMLSFLTYCPPKGKENTMTMAAAALAMQNKPAADAPVITGTPAALQSGSASSGAASSSASAASSAASGGAAQTPMALRGSNDALFRGMSAQIAGKSTLKPQATYTYNFGLTPANGLNCYTDSVNGVSYIASTPVFGGTPSGTASITAGTVDITTATTIGTSAIDISFGFTSTGIKVTYASCSLLVIDYTTIQNWDGQIATLKNFMVPVTISGTITSSGTLNYSGTVSYAASANPNVMNVSANASGTAHSTAASADLNINYTGPVSMNLTLNDTMSVTSSGTLDMNTNPPTASGTQTLHYVHDITGTIGADAVNIHFPMTYTETF